MLFSLFFFFNDTATTEIYTLSLHDALPIWLAARRRAHLGAAVDHLALGVLVGHPRDGPLLVDARLGEVADAVGEHLLDRKSTRLNSSHANISYAVFCLKKKTTKKNEDTITE